MAFFVVSSRLSTTNGALVLALRRIGVRAELATPEEACERAQAGDTVLARLDVRPTLDGMEAGASELRRLGHRGVRLLNQPGALLAAHDKLATALRLGSLDIPHPRTAHVERVTAAPKLRPPVVVKPRFGSWGRDVVLCETDDALAECLGALRRRRWFRRQGALIQELVPPRGYDLRVVVASGQVVGAIERVAAPGEWRTNVALGGRRRPVFPPTDACALAVEAAAAIGADLVGVDLLPDDDRGWVVLELNGAVDFTVEYSLDGEDVFDEIALALAIPAELPLAVSALS